MLELPEILPSVRMGAASLWAVANLGLFCLCEPMSRRIFTWTDHQLDKLNKVKEILEDLKDYKPLTLRQVYYQLVGKGFIENRVSQYGMLSNLLKWARIEGFISWDDIEDRVRVFHDLTGWDRSETFVKVSLGRFLTGYKRDLLQTQDKLIEVWIEKDALSSVFTRVAERYTIPVVVCRGFSSVSFLNDFRERIEAHKGKAPLMLYFGDFDPSGMEMLEAMQTTLRDELGMNGIEFKRVALKKEDIFTYKLPHNPDALKKTDTRAKKHLEAYGKLAVELDALRPDVLEQKIKDGIETELDINLFNIEVRKNNKEVRKLNQMKATVEKFFKKEEGMLFLVEI